MTNSADPDQLASSEANRSGPTLFAKTGHVVFSKRRVKILTSNFQPIRLLDLLLIVDTNSHTGPGCSKRR